MRTSSSMVMPAEWAPHDGVWIGYPHDPAEWGDALEAARADVAAFATAVYADGEGETVWLVVQDAASAEDARGRVAPGVALFTEPLGDIWLRDTAAIVRLGPDGAREAVDFGFNGWGGKYVMTGDADIGARLATNFRIPFVPEPTILEGGAIDVDGAGLCVTTEQCLLNPNRNPGRSKADLEAVLARTLGIGRVLWLGDGLMNDHTDGHVDNLARFTAPGRLLLPEAAPDDPNAAVFADAWARARAFGLEPVALPSPGRVEIAGAVAAASYMNFYVGNAVVVVPAYGRPADEAARAVLAAEFPDRRVVSVPARGILAGGGSFHCASQQLPSILQGARA